MAYCFASQRHAGSRAWCWKEGSIFAEPHGVLTGSCVCMPVVGRLHGRYLRYNKIESIPADAFTALVNLKRLYVPPCSMPHSLLCRARCTKTRASVSQRRCCRVAHHAVRSKDIHTKHELYKPATHTNAHHTCRTRSRRPSPCLRSRYC